MGDGGRTEHDVGEILRRHGREYSRSHPVSARQRRVMQPLASCRTAELGGHLERCDGCGHERPVYNSCGDRHCPKCQGAAARKWLDARLGELLPVPYFHCVFTIPDSLNVLVPRNERVFYGLLFRAASAALRHLARRHFGGDLGVVAVLHTWGQTLWLHPHIHCIITGGALSRDRSRWVSWSSRFLFDVAELSGEFRRRFCRLLRRAALTLDATQGSPADASTVEELITEAESQYWTVYCKKPFSGPADVLRYVSRYTHRVAISNRRIQAVSNDGTVTFSYKDYRDKDVLGRPRQKSMTLSATEFIGRFLRHVLPRGFRRIRSYGILAGRERAAKLAACREILGPTAAVEQDPTAAVCPDTARCPACGNGMMLRVLLLHPQRGPPVVLPWTRSGVAHAA